VIILGAADALRKLIGSSPTPLELAEYEQELSTLRGKMAPAAFETAWAQGQRRNMDEAITLATQE
jgi:hypothetical protein